MDEPKTIARRVDDDGSLDPVIMTTMLLSLPRPIEKLDAIAVFPGLGGDERLIAGVNAYNRAERATRLLIAGHNRNEQTWKLITTDLLRRPPFGLRTDRPVLIQEHADHTKAQAEWVVERIRDQHITSLGLVISPYHQVRATCTLLKTLPEEEWIPIIPLPAAISPQESIPETIAKGDPVKGWDMVPGEMKRLLTYQEKGDIMTAAELRLYLTWLWEGPFLDEYRDL